MTSLWSWNPVSVFIVHVLVINSHKLSVQVAEFTGADLRVFQTKPLMVYATVSGSKSEIYTVLHDVSDVAIVTTEPSLIWKMSFFHFEKIFCASIAVQDVHVRDGDTQVVSWPSKNSPPAVLFRRIRKRVVLGCNCSPTLVKCPSTFCRERERGRERESNLVH